VKFDRAPRLAVAAMGAALMCLSATACGGDEPEAKPTPTTNLPSIMAGQAQKRTIEQGDVDTFWVKYNDIMRTCMKEQGFEYRNYVPTTDKKVALGLTDQQFAQQYGYGISTLIDYLAPGSQREDPNFKTMQKLDTAARTSFSKQFALCQQRVQDKIGPPPTGGAIKMTAADQKAMDGVLAKTTSDARVQKAKTDRAACLESKGFTAGEDLTGPISSAAEKYTTKFENAAGALDAQGRSSDKLKLTDVLDNDEMADLKKIQKREIAMAVETSPCQSAYDAAYKSVYAEQLQKALKGEK
jgi:hypothetical protein